MLLRWYKRMSWQHMPGYQALVSWKGGTHGVFTGEHAVHLLQGSHSAKREWETQPDACRWPRSMAGMESLTGRWISMLKLIYHLHARGSICTAECLRRVCKIHCHQSCAKLSMSPFEHLAWAGRDYTSCLCSLSMQQCQSSMLFLPMQMFDGTLRTDTLTKDKLKGPASGRIVSDIEARINDGKRI